MSKKFKLIVSTGNTDNNQTVDVTQGQGGRGPVSYTHLTLPTILRV